MSTVDKETSRALAQDDQLVLAEMNEELGVFAAIALSLSGKQAWVTWYSYALGFAAFCAGVYCATQFFATADLKLALGWALGIIVCLFVLSIIKVIGWQQLLRQELLREIRRLEMRLQMSQTKNDSATSESA